MPTLMLVVENLKGANGEAEDVRTFPLPKGDRTECGPHLHNERHLTSCLAGKMEVSLDEASFIMMPGDKPVWVEAWHMHSAIGLVDGTIMRCEFEVPADKVDTWSRVERIANRT